MGTMYPHPRFEDYADEMRRQAIANAQLNAHRELLSRREDGAGVDHGSTVSQPTPLTVESSAQDPVLPTEARNNDDWFDLVLIVLLVAFGVAMTFFQRLT